MDFFYLLYYHFWIFLVFLLILDWYFREDYMPTKCTFYDQIAINQAVCVLHAYAQKLQKKPVNLEVEVTEKLIMGTLVHIPKDPSLLQGWEFFPFNGKTGFKSWGKGYLKQSSMLGFIGLNKQEKLVTVVFRNSRRLTDWVHNLQWSFKKSSHVNYEGNLHEGYSAILVTCKDEIDELLKTIIKNNNINNDYKILITGHSLGGAMATLLATYIADHTFYTQYFTKKNLHLVTFAAPYVGTKCNQFDFQSWLAQRIGYLKCFERSTDIAPFFTQISQLKLRKKSWHISLSTNIKPVPITTPTKLFHFDDSRFDFRQAHTISKYRKAIYIELAEPYSPLYIRI